MLLIIIFSFFLCSHIGASAKLELVDKFCYLGDMLSVDGDAGKRGGGMRKLLKQLGIRR